MLSAHRRGVTAPQRTAEPFLANLFRTTDFMEDTDAFTTRTIPRPARRDDLWSGAGLACAYAGGCGRGAIESLRVAANGHLPAFAQGVAFAAKTRQRAANLNQHTETVCRLICGHTAEETAAITDAALENLREEGDVPAYEVWRRRIQNKIAQCSEFNRLCTKVSSRTVVTASPPDVRRGSAAPSKLFRVLGCALGSAFGPEIWAKPEPRAQPNEIIQD